MTSFYRLDGLEKVPETLRGAMVAIGSFDGVHRGHQSVLARLKEQARARGVPAVMLTFEPHPRDVFAPAPFMFRLTPPDIKARLAAAFGLDGIVMMPFSRDLSMVEAEDFVDPEVFRRDPDAAAAGHFAVCPRQIVESGAVGMSGHLRARRATACAEMPSPRPSNPMPSVVVALTLTQSGGISRS